MESTKLLVIGAGPAGIALGVEAANAGISGTILLEKTEHPCNTIVTLYREGKRIDPVYKKLKVAPQGVLSFDTLPKESFLAWIDSLIEKYHLDIRYKHEALDIKRVDDGFRVTCGNDAIINAQYVAIAIGVFGRPVKPSYPIPKELKDCIHFSLPAEAPQGKQLLIVGGGDSAAEAACYLSQMNRVTLSYRREAFFRINNENICTLNQCCSYKDLEVRLGVDITELQADNGRVKVFYQPIDEAISYDAVFYFLGGSTPQAFLEKAHVAFAHGQPVTDPFGETNIPGLFLAGDLAHEKGTIMAAFNSAVSVIKKIYQTG